MTRPHGPLALSALAALCLAGCMPPAQPYGPPVQGPVPLRPTTVAEAALAQAPPLLLDDQVLHGEQAILEKLQDALAGLKKNEEARAELEARLAAATQRGAARDAQLDELQRQAAQLDEVHKASAASLARAEAELKAATARLAELEPQAKQAAAAAAETARLTAELATLKGESEKLHDKLLTAELDRVKAQQDLVALQIIMARQRALLRRRPAADEDQARQGPPAPGAQEAAP